MWCLAEIQKVHKCPWFVSHESETWGMDDGSTLSPIHSVFLLSVFLLSADVWLLSARQSGGRELTGAPWAPCCPNSPKLRAPMC